MPQTDALFKRYRKKTVYVLYVAVVLLFLLAAIKSVRASALEELEPSVSTGQETVKSIVTAGEMKSDSGLSRGTPELMTQSEAAPDAAAEPLEEVFSQWNEDAPALHALIEYVEAVTDEASPDYIPPEDRIATFDLDGTLMGELAPIYLEMMLLTDRILADPSYQPDEEMLEYGRITRDHALDRSFPKDYYKKLLSSIGWRTTQIGYENNMSSRYSAARLFAGSQHPH